LRNERNYQDFVALVEQVNAKLAGKIDFAVLLATNGQKRKEMVTDARNGAREQLAAANRAPLDRLNFLLGNVKDGLGPFLAIFLMSSQHWDAGSIGIVLTISGVTTAVARGPFGALVDAVRCKRTLIAVGVLVVASAAVAMALIPTFWPVAIAQVFTGAADAIFPSAVAAISLGIVGRKMFTHRVGRNEAFNHAGNVVTAIVAGDPYALVAVQLLEGAGAGIFGTLFFIVVADLTKGTGRYNLALGASGACWGLGAAFSNGVAGFIVNAFGFSAAFLFLSACALIAVLLFWLGVPETRDMATEVTPETAKPLPSTAVAGA
jgi:MFS family permease